MRYIPPALKRKMQAEKLEVEKHNGKKKKNVRFEDDCFVCIIGVKPRASCICVGHMGICDPQKTLRLVLPNWEP